MFLTHGLISVAALLPLQTQYGDSLLSSNVLRNSNFEELNTDGHTAANPFVDGLFWIGAEDRTIATATNRFVRLAGGAFVYQTFGVANFDHESYSDSVQLSGKVRLNNSANRGAITLNEAPRASAMEWDVLLPDSEFKDEWEFYVQNAAGTLVQMPRTGTRQYSLNQARVSATIGSVALADFVDEPLVITWTAPAGAQSSDIRIMLRPSSRPNNISSNGVIATLVRSPIATWSPTTITSAPVEIDNEGGVVVLAKVTNLAAGERMRTSCTRQRR